MNGLNIPPPDPALCWLDGRFFFFLKIIWAAREIKKTENNYKKHK